MLSSSSVLSLFTATNAWIETVLEWDANQQFVCCEFFWRNKQMAHDIYGSAICVSNFVIKS